jgi:Ca2+-binding RTX toxin-like protein
MSDLSAGPVRANARALWRAVDPSAKNLASRTVRDLEPARALALAAGQHVETLRTPGSASTSTINLTGNELANTVLGNAGTNMLNGGGGADYLRGYAGNDTYWVDHAGDSVIEAAGGGDDTVIASVNHTLGAGQHVETLRTFGSGTTNPIDLAGNELANTLLGNAAANTLNGKGGTDSLRGYAGHDTFVFSTALGAGNIDTIADFSVADDTIAIDNAVFAGLAGGALAAGAFRTGAAAADASDRIIYNPATGALMFDADGTGAGAAVQFAALTAGLALTASDFLVI